MQIKIVRKKISKRMLEKLAQEGFGEMVKVVVDIKRGIIAAGGELHADAEEKLLRDGSQLRDLWGVNVYLDEPKRERIEFSALINIRPSLGNRLMEIQDPKIRKKVQKIIDQLIA